MSCSSVTACGRAALVLVEVHLNHLVQEYVRHYHHERPHQGLDNKLITLATPPDEKIPLLQQIICHERLGGLLKDYERCAA
jgi:transposase InsO family protein